MIQRDLIRFLRLGSLASFLFCFGLITLVAATSIITLVGCKKSWSTSHVGYIVGVTNDIVVVDDKTADRIPPNVLNAAILLATQLRDGSVKFCSGTLTEGKDGNSLYAVTNHHCFASTTDEGDATKEVFPESCTNTTVYLGFNKLKVDELTTLGCKAGTFRSSYDFDVAMFEISGNIPSEYKPLSFWKEDVIPGNREALIVHYPDVATNLARPQGEKVSLPLASVTLDDCKVVGRFEVREWDLDRTLPVGIRHSCDLIHGSSGSGLIDKETGTILGVNWGGIKINYDSGVRTDNAATHAKYVKAFLEGKEEEAKSELDTYRQSEESREMSGRSGSSKGFADQVKKSVCGVAALGDNQDLGAASNKRTSWYLLMALFLGLPVFVSVTHRFFRETLR